MKISTSEFVFLLAAITFFIYSVWYEVTKRIEKKEQKETENKNQDKKFPGINAVMIANTIRATFGEIVIDGAPLTIEFLFDYDCVESPGGMTGFGVYDVENKHIYVACDLYGILGGNEEDVLTTVEHSALHELCHALQDRDGKPFDEDEAEKFADGNMFIFDARRVFELGGKNEN